MADIATLTFTDVVSEEVFLKFKREFEEKNPGMEYRYGLWDKKKRDVVPYPVPESLHEAIGAT